MNLLTSNSSTGYLICNYKTFPKTTKEVFRGTVSASASGLQSCVWGTATSGKSRQRGQSGLDKRLLFWNRMRMVMNTFLSSSTMRPRNTRDQRSIQISKKKCTGNASSLSLTNQTSLYPVLKSIYLFALLMLPQSILEEHSCPTTLLPLSWQ